MDLATALTAETGRATVEDTRDLIVLAISRLESALASVNGSLSNDTTMPMVELDWAFSTLLDTDHALTIAVQELAAVLQK